MGSPSCPRKVFACFYFLLLVVLQLEALSCVDGSSRYGSFTTSSSTSDHDQHQHHQQVSPAESSGGLRGQTVEDGDHPDELFGDDKRKIQTGPNPLHNR